MWRGGGRGGLGAGLQVAVGGGGRGGAGGEAPAVVIGNLAVTARAPTHQNTLPSLYGLWRLGRCGRSGTPCW